jgi:hypothetical protein
MGQIVAVIRPTNDPISMRNGWANQSFLGREGDNEEERTMHTIAKLGLAAALLVGGANAAIAQVDVDAGVGADVSAGAGDTEVDTSVDTSTTGSISASDRNYGSVISSLRSGTSADLTAFDTSSSVNCVAISSLQGDAENNAEALDAALSSNESGLMSLRSSIEGNAELMTKLETSCAASIDDFGVEDVIAVETGTDGSFIFYVDDRA